MRLAFLTPFISLLCTCFYPINAQSANEPLPTKRKNAILLGIAGNSPFVSLNYHRQLLHFKKSDDKLIGFVDMGLGVGLEVIDLGFFGGGVEFGPTFPHSLTLNLGSRKHFFELGYAGVLVGEGTSASHYIFNPLIGWRFKKNKGMIRTYFSTSVFQEEESTVVLDANQYPVVVGTQSVTKIRPSVGLSVGMTF